MPMCIPEAVGVPWVNEAPQWWDNSAAKPRSYSTDLNDYRWDGATRREYQYGTSTDATFRSVYADEGGQRYLYLLWHVYADPSANIGSDSVFVGFQQSDGSAYVIEVDAYATVSADQAGVTPAGINVVKQQGTSWVGGIATPGWLNQFTKGWLIRQPPNYEWAVAMCVPIAAAPQANLANGIGLANQFKFFYAIATDYGQQTGVYCMYWPRNDNNQAIEIAIDPNTLQNKYADPGVWDLVTVGGAGQVACGPGVSLDRQNIGTTNPDPNTGIAPSTWINASLNNPTPNTIFAKPLNGTQQAIPQHAIRASFRTANWGSQVPWSGQFAAGATPWEEILDGTPDPAHRDNQNAIPANQLGDVSFVWTITTQQAADWVGPNAPKMTHQCMLVTLSAPGQNIDFVNDSIYQNMNFAKTSTFERPFAIDLRGIPRPRARGPVAPSTDVFVFVTARNMPKTSPRPIRPIDVEEVFHPEKPFTRTRIMPLIGGPIVGRAGAITAIDRGALDIRDVADSPLRARQPIDRNGDHDPPEPPEPPEPPDPPHPPERPEPPVTTNDLLSHLPNVRYFPYYATGRQIRIGGKLRPVIRPLTSFGYIIQQSRAVVGWDFALGGAFTKVGPNVYKVGVTPGTSKTVLTRIVGYEDRLPQKRLAEIVAGPPGRIQSTIPVLKNLPSVTNVVRNAASNVIRRR